MAAYTHKDYQVDTEETQTVHQNPVLDLGSAQPKVEKPLRKARAIGIPSVSQLALIQGIYFFLTGIWPLLSLNSFLRFTGPKTDLWLVITVGILLTIIGVVLASAGIRKKVQLELNFLGFATAGSLAALEIYFTARGVISVIYLLDALIEMGFVLLWILAWVPRERDECAPLVP
jgi:hypothetical protein